MKARVRISDKYTGRSINLIVNLENTFADKYEFSYSKLSSYQRGKIEKFFGKNECLLYECRYSKNFLIC